MREFLLISKTYAHKVPLWWLLGTSVRESDGCARDCFMFLRAVAFPDERIQEHFSCQPVACRTYAVQLLMRRKLTGRKALPSTTRTRWRLERALFRYFCFSPVELRPLFG